MTEATKEQIIELEKLKERFLSLTEELRMRDVKYCKRCDKVKIVNEFYKTFNSKKTKTSKTYYQTYCKKCSNVDRNNYKRTYVKPVKKLKGFEALDEEMQKSILYDLHIKLTKKSIAIKNKLNYQAFLRWTKKDTFPKYKPPVVEYDDRCGECGRDNDFCSCLFY